jgi:uncharacterized protein YacL
MSAWTSRSFGWRTLFLWGQVGMTITHLLLASFIWLGFDTGTVLILCVFMIIYSHTSGPIAWIYAQETLTDAGLGVSLNVLFGIILILSLSTPYLMPSPLHASGTYFLFAFFAFIGPFFVFYFFKESMGLTEKEKKELYMPLDLKEENALVEEQHIEELHS